MPKTRRCARIAVGFFVLALGTSSVSAAQARPWVEAGLGLGRDRVAVGNTWRSTIEAVAGIRVSRLWGIGAAIDEADGFSACEPSSGFASRTVFADLHPVGSWSIRGGFGRIPRARISTYGHSTECEVGFRETGAGGLRRFGIAFENRPFSRISARWSFDFLSASSGEYSGSSPQRPRRPLDVQQIQSAMSLRLGSRQPKR